LKIFFSFTGFFQIKANMKSLTIFLMCSKMASGRETKKAAFQQAAKFFSFSAKKFFILGRKIKIS